MKFIIFLVSLLPFIGACNNDRDAAAETYVKFDKTKWQSKEGEAFPYRDDMLKDLIDSVDLKNISYDSLINILGQPDRVNEGHLYYNVYKKEIGFVTLGTKAFVIKLKPDSTVEWRKIYGG
jgi:hypothetical protein